MEIDVPESDGCDVRESFIRWEGSAGGAPTLDHFMQLPRIVGNYRIGQERQRA
jgi:hypothetical protein